MSVAGARVPHRMAPRCAERVRTGIHPTSVTPGAGPLTAASTREEGNCLLRTWAIAGSAANDLLRRVFIEMDRDVPVRPQCSRRAGT